LPIVSSILFLISMCNSLFAKIAESLTMILLFYSS
jgi:hypothetical protein